MSFNGVILVYVMAFRLFSAKPLPEPMLTYCQYVSWERTSVIFLSKLKQFCWRKCICRLQNVGHLISASDRLQIVCLTVCSGADWCMYVSFYPVEMILFLEIPTSTKLSVEYANGSNFRITLFLHKYRNGLKAYCPIHHRRAIVIYNLIIIDL